MTKFISAVLLLQLFLAGVAEECASSETSVLLQMGWWHGVEGQAKSKQLEDAPPVDPAYGDDDLGLGSGDLMHPLISLDGALIRQPLSGKGIFHGGITWDSPHWQRHRKLPKGWRMQEILNSAEFFDWVALGLAMILAYILRHYWLWQVAGEKQMASHGVSLLIWLGLGGALAFAISLRFGKGHGEEWIAGYFFEFFFMLENVFVFRAVITALSLSDAMVAKVLDWVVNFQIIFEAVFFLGLAHQLRALHLLPQVLGLGLLFFGLLTLRESFAKSKACDGEDWSVPNGAVHTFRNRADEVVAPVLVRLRLPMPLEPKQLDKLFKGCKCSTCQDPQMPKRMRISSASKRAGRS